MDSQKHVIIIYDKKYNKNIDRCDDIKSIFRKGHLLEVHFNDGNVYSYGSSKIEWLTEPQEVSLKNQAIFKETIPLVNVLKILKFENWYKVFYENGIHKSYHISELNFIETCEDKKIIKDVIDYLSKVSKFISGVEEGQDFLYNQLTQLTPIKDCALDRFLSKKDINKTAVPSVLIYPFGCNYSQMEAVRKAFSNDFSLIQGPPGTGKTHTILNIVANAIINNKSVAVVSGNNEATRNVEEKLEKEKLSFLTAFLGNKKNIEDFFNKTHLIPINSINNWKNITNKQIDKRQLDDLNKKVSNALSFQIEIPKLKKKIYEIKIEQAINDAEYNIRKRNIPEKIKKMHFTSRTILQFAAELESLSEKNYIVFLID